MQYIKGYEIAIGWVITELSFIFSVWIWCLRKTSDQQAKKVKLLVHSESRYRTGRSNACFSFLCLTSDLGTPFQEREECAVSASLVEVHTDVKENKFIHDGVVLSGAVQAAQGLTHLPAPAHSSGGNLLSYEEEPQVSLSRQSCRPKPPVLQKDTTIPAVNTWTLTPPNSLLNFGSYR